MVQNLHFDEKLMVAEGLIKSKYAEDKLVSMRIYNTLINDIDNNYVQGKFKKFFKDGVIKG